MITTIAAILVTTYVTVEFATAIYIVMNRKTAIPRIRRNLQHLMGISEINYKIDNLHSKMDNMDSRNESNHYFNNKYTF